MSKETKLINRIKKGFNVSGTIFIEKGVRDFNYGETNVVFKASIWHNEGHSIKQIEAPTFIDLCRKTFETLDAMGLNK